MNENFKKTSDPNVVIEAQYPGYTRYRNLLSGRRWEVRGFCDRRGDCLIGSTIEGEFIRDHEHLRELCLRLGKNRIDSNLDVPITPEFKGCCPFTYTELPPT